MAQSDTAFDGSRGPRGSAVRGEPTTVSPWPARERWVPSGRRRSGGGSHRWADQNRGRREVGQAPRRHRLGRMRTVAGAEPGRAHTAGGHGWRNRIKVESLWAKGASPVPRCCAGQARGSGLAGSMINHSLPSAAAGRSECSAEDRAAVGAGLESRWQTRGRDSTRAAKRRVLPKPVREAANFCADIARLNASHWQAGLDCNDDSRTPRRVQGARCSERAGDPGSLTPQKPARCASGAR